MSTPFQKQASEPTTGTQQEQQQVEQAGFKDVILAIQSLSKSLSDTHHKIIQQNQHILDTISVRTPISNTPAPQNVHTIPTDTQMPISVQAPVIPNQIHTQSQKYESMKDILDLKKLLGTFGDEDVEKANDFLKRVQYQKEQFLVSEQTFLKTLATCMQGFVMQWFISKKFEDFESFKKAFEIEYCQTLQMRQGNLFRLSKNREENLETYCKRVKQSCLSASIAEEWQIIGYFIQGLPYYLKRLIPDSQSFASLQVCLTHVLMLQNISSAGRDQREYSNNQKQGNENTTGNNNVKGRYNPNNKGRSQNFVGGSQEQQNSVTQPTVTFAPDMKYIEPHCIKEVPQDFDNQEQIFEKFQQSLNIIEPFYGDAEGSSRMNTQTPNVKFCKNENVLNANPTNTSIEWIQNTDVDTQPILQKHTHNLGENPALYQQGMEQNALAPDVLAAIKRQRFEQPKPESSHKIYSITGRPNTLAYRDYDIFQQLNHTKASCSVLELMTIEPYKSQVLQALGRQQNLDELRKVYNKSQQDKYFAGASQEFEESQQYQAKSQEFQQHAQQYVQQLQQVVIQQGRQQAAPQQQAQQTTQPQAPPQGQAPQRQDERMSMQYMQPNNTQSILAVSKKSAVDVYRDYVTVNNHEPDYDDVQSPKGELNKYIIIVRVGDKLAAAQIDSGSHFCVITYDTVQRYNLQHLMQPSNQQYTTASGQSVSFKGMLKLPIQVGSLSVQIQFQVTDANSYTFLLGQDAMRFLKANLLTSSNVLSYFDNNRNPLFLPMYANYEDIPNNIMQYLKSFQGIPVRGYSKNK